MFNPFKSIYLGMVGKVANQNLRNFFKYSLPLKPYNQTETDA